jgi:cathepsin A (carboxypeptidase C)
MGSLNQGYAPCDPKVGQISGYFDINATENKHYFFWAFDSRSNPETDPVVLWLTGGPGCSSGLAVLRENGPCKLNEHMGIENNTYSWNNFATVIYMDQPAGVGYSYSDNGGLDTNETEVANDMYVFMQALYKQYPALLKKPLFVYGESYGGHFAPAVAHRIFQGNQRKEGIHLPLRGLSTGNGLTDPAVQYKYYADLAYNWCDTVLGHPCVTKAVYDKMTSEIPACIAAIDDCNMEKNNSACLGAHPLCRYQMNAFYETGLNVYDIRRKCTFPGLCYNFTAESDFFNSAPVQDALLGASRAGRTWAICNGTVNGMFGSDWYHDFDRFIPPMMEIAGIRVLVYAGDMDFICNWIGNKHWTLGLEWVNRTAYRAAPDIPWYLDAIPAGIFRTVASPQNNLQFTFLQIHGAGHMVPMDQPKRALEMVRHFLNDIPFH